MASKPLATIPSRMALLRRPITTSSSLPTTATKASSRSISSLSLHKPVPILQSSSFRPLPPQTASHNPASTPRQLLRHESTQPTPEQEIKSYKFEDITSSPTQILIDVREPAELTSTGIIPSALSIPLASHPDALFLTPSEFETRFGFPKPGVTNAEADPEAKPDPGSDGSPKRIVFYCKAGVRARAAAQLAVKAGYDPEELGVYDGSWLDWEKRGGKMERWEGDE